MKTRIWYKDGRVEELDGAFPSVDIEYRTVCLCDSVCEVVTEDVPLSEIARLEFTPEEVI